jgi:signal transduction histidine kinase
MATHTVADERAALLEIALLVARDAPCETVFAAVAEEGARRFGSDGASVLRYLGEERAVVVGFWRPPGARGLPVNAEVDFDRRNSALGRIRTTGAPSRADGYEGQRGELPLLMRAIDVRATIAAPVVVGEELWGALVVSTSREEPFPAGAEDRLGDLTELAASAIAHEQVRHALSTSRRRIVEASDETRRRLERELHEGVQQHLLALTLKLRVAHSRVEPGSVAAGLLEEALAEADVANGELRDLARAVFPKVLSERGLAAALQAVAARAAVRVELRELPRRRFPALAEATAYFVVAETLAALPDEPSAEVAVADRGELLLVEISHETLAVADAGLAERVTAVGGRLHVDRNGVLRAEVPVSPRDPRAR